MDSERETPAAEQHGHDWEAAVVDRFVNGEFAVLLVGPQEVERVVLRSTLPRETQEGTWLKTGWDGATLLWAELDPAATEQARNRVADKLARLRQRGRRL